MNSNPADSSASDKGESPEPSQLQTAMILILITALTLQVAAADRIQLAGGAGQCATPLAQTLLTGVEINSDEWPALAHLPGIGESFARRIVQAREKLRQSGGPATQMPFNTPNDLLKVPGIGKKTIMRIRPFVRCERPAIH